MMRSLLWSLLLLSACGPGATPAPRTATPASTASAAGQRFELPGHGASAVFPGPPQVATSRGAGGQTLQLHYKGKQEYTLMSVSTGGSDRQTDEHWFESVRAKLKLQKRGEPEQQSFRGMEIGGIYEGRETLARLFAVGDTLFTVLIQADPSKLDVEAARRFFASLELELPWRIYASPTTGFSVMVPTHAIEVDRTDPASEGRATTRAFVVGGRDSLSYWVKAEEIISRDVQVSDDRLLDAALDQLRDSGQDITFQGPVEATGMRGREFLSRKDGETLRGRLWIGARFMYLLMIGAKSETALRDARASRFFDSLVCY